MGVERLHWCWCGWQSFLGALQQRLLVLQENVIFTSETPVSKGLCCNGSATSWRDLMQIRLMRHLCGLSASSSADAL